jgi:DegV family protein with EDD domain
VDDIVAEIKRVRQQSGVFFTVDVFDNLLRSGRVGRGRALVAGWLDIKPILELTTEGHVQPIARVRGMKGVLPRMLELMELRVPRTAQNLRFGVVHVGCPEDQLEEIRAALNARFGEREIITAPATPVLATHLGPGAWGLCWQLED